ncbi:hypothetical protein CGRA01v4_04697 [Colletotrichum graminicola]|nr:hypothetical protein CGRA01v4_04697 [Colletotrichum graminicola]
MPSKIVCSKAGSRQLSVASNLISPLNHPAIVRPETEKDTSSASYRECLDIRPSSRPQEYGGEGGGGYNTPLSIRRTTLPASPYLPGSSFRKFSFSMNEPPSIPVRKHTPPPLDSKRPSRDGLNQTCQRMQQCPTLGGGGQCTFVPAFCARLVLTEE